MDRPPASAHHAARLAALSTAPNAAASSPLAVAAAMADAACAWEEPRLPAEHGARAQPGGALPALPPPPPPLLLREGVASCAYHRWLLPPDWVDKSLPPHVRHHPPHVVSVREGELSTALAWIRNALGLSQQRRTEAGGSAVAARLVSQLSGREVRRLALVSHANSDPAARLLLLAVCADERGRPLPLHQLMHLALQSRARLVMGLETAILRHWRADAPCWHAARLALLESYARLLLTAPCMLYSYTLLDALRSPPPAWPAAEAPRLQAMLLDFFDVRLCWVLRRQARPADHSRPVNGLKLLTLIIAALLRTTSSHMLFALAESAALRLATSAATPRDLVDCYEHMLKDSLPSSASASASASAASASLGCASAVLSAAHRLAAAHPSAVERSHIFPQAMQQIGDLLGSHELLGSQPNSRPGTQRRPTLADAAGVPAPLPYTVADAAAGEAARVAAGAAAAAAAAPFAAVNGWSADAAGAEPPALLGRLVLAEAAADRFDAATALHAAIRHRPQLRRGLLLGMLSLAEQACERAAGSTDERVRAGAALVARIGPLCRRELLFSTAFPPQEHAVCVRLLVAHALCSAPGAEVMRGATFHRRLELLVAMAWGCADEGGGAAAPGETPRCGLISSEHLTLALADCVPLAPLPALAALRRTLVASPTLATHLSAHDAADEAMGEGGAAPRFAECFRRAALRGTPAGEAHKGSDGCLCSGRTAAHPVGWCFDDSGAERLEARHTAAPDPLGCWGGTDSPDFRAAEASPSPKAPTSAPAASVPPFVYSSIGRRLLPCLDLVLHRLLVLAHHGPEPASEPASELASEIAAEASSLLADLLTRYRPLYSSHGGRHAVVLSLLALLASPSAAVSSMERVRARSTTRVLLLALVAPIHASDRRSVPRHLTPQLANFARATLEGAGGQKSGQSGRFREGSGKVQGAGGQKSGQSGRQGGGGDETAADWVAACAAADASPEESPASTPAPTCLDGASEAFCSSGRFREGSGKVQGDGASEAFCSSLLRTTTSRLAAAVDGGAPLPSNSAVEGTEGVEVRMWRPSFDWLTLDTPEPAQAVLGLARLELLAAPVAAPSLGRALAAASLRFSPSSAAGSAAWGSAASLARLAASGQGGEGQAAGLTAGWLAAHAADGTRQAFRERCAAELAAAERTSRAAPALWALDGLWRATGTRLAAEECVHLLERLATRAAPHATRGEGATGEAGGARALQAGIECAAPLLERLRGEKDAAAAASLQRRLLEALCELQHGPEARRGEAAMLLDDLRAHVARNE